MKFVKQLYMGGVLVFLCVSTPLFATGEGNNPEDYQRDMILDKVEDLVWECAKQGYTDLAISISSALVNYPWKHPQDELKFLDLRAKMYLLNGDEDNADADRAIHRMKLIRRSKN